jgi:hypothetical protein
MLTQVQSAALLAAVFRNCHLLLCCLVLLATSGTTIASWSCLVLTWQQVSGRWRDR